MLPPTITGTQRVVVNALLFGLALRLFQLDDLSLWADEGATWWNATRASWAATALAEHNHPPVWWLLTRFVLGIVTPDESALRIPAVVCGVVAIALAGLVARRLSDPARVPSRGGFTGLSRDAVAPVVILASIGPFWIAMSQEARMYSALLAESLGLTLLYLRWLDRDGKGPLVGYGLLAVLTLYTQYLAVLPIAAHLVHAFLLSRRTRADARPVRLVPFLTTVVLAGVAFVPWFLYFLQQPPGVSTTIFPPYDRWLHSLWRMGVGPAFVPLDRPRAEAGPMSVVLEQPVAIALSALLFLAPVVAGIRALRADRGLRLFLATGILVPSVLILLLGIKYPLVEEKYLVFLTPLLLLLAVLGCLRATGVRRIALFAGLFAVHVAGLVAYHARNLPAVTEVLGGGHRYGKEQWREVEAAVTGALRAEGGGEVLIHAPFCAWTWAFYSKGRPSDGYHVLPSWARRCDVPATADTVLETVPSLASARFVVLILSHECSDGRDDWMKAVLDALERVWGTTPSFVLTAYPVQWGIRAVAFTRR